MSYTPTEWKNGDTITAEKLNNIEEGIENNEALVVEFDYYQNPENVYDAYLISKTPITNAIAAFKTGKTVVFHTPFIERFEIKESYLKTVSLYLNELTNDGVTDRFMVDYTGLDGTLNFANAYVDNSGYYHVDLYID